MLDSESNPGFFRAVAMRLAALTDRGNSDENAGENGPVKVSLLTLEDRVLYSAVPVPVDLVAQVDAIDNAIESTCPTFTEPVDPLVGLLGPESTSVLDPVDFASNIEADSGEQLPDFSDDVLSEDVSDQDEQLLLPEAASSVITNELVVVDRGVEGYQQLVDDLITSQSGNRSFEIIYLDTETSGIESLSRQLSDRVIQGMEPYDALHLISHGDDGTIQLGSDRLSGSNLNQFEESIAQWGDALAVDADLLIYGCDVAATDSGIDLIDSLASLTGADVAASDDITGHQTLNGDWEFEYTVGLVESEVAFSQTVQQNWEHSLVTQVQVASESGGQAQAIGVDGRGRTTFVSSVNDSSVNDTTTDGFDVFLEFTDQFGNTSDIVVNETLEGDQVYASVAVAENGTTAVTWTSISTTGERAVYAKVYDGANNVVRSEFRVDVPTLAIEADDSSIAIDAAGNFVIVWESTDGSTSEVLAQRFYADGSANGQVFNVSGTGANAIADSGNAFVASNDSGQFVVVWDDFDGSNGNENGVFARTYNPDGTGSEIVTVENRPGQLVFQAVADINSAGDYVVAYTFKQSTGNTDQNVRAETLHFDGQHIVANDSFVTSSAGNQFAPSVAFLENGEVTVAWEGSGTGESGVPDPQGVFVGAFEFDNMNAVGPQVSTGEVLPTVNVGDAQSGVTLTSHIDGGFPGSLITGNEIANFNPPGTIADESPSGTDATVLVSADGPRTISESDFGFSDPEDALFTQVQISRSPQQGRLLLNGVPITDGQVLLEDELMSGILTYEPDANFTGEDNVLFFVHDGIGYADSFSTLTFQLTGGTATGQDNSITLPEDSSHTFADSDFGFNNIDGDTLNQVRIVNAPQFGQLLADGVLISDGDEVLAAVIQAGQLVYQPVGDFSGEDTLEFEVNDDNGFSVNSNTLTFQVTPVVDGPSLVRGDGFGAATVTAPVNLETTGDQHSPTITSLPSGNYIVVWQSDDTDLALDSDNDGNTDDGQQVFLQQFDAANNRVGTTVLVAGHLAGDQTDPSVTTLADGTYIVALTTPSLDGTDVVAQRFDLNGNVLLSDGMIDTDRLATITLAQHDSNDQRDVTVTALSNGGFVAAWTTLDQMLEPSDSSATVARIFDANGNGGEEFLLNTVDSMNPREQTSPQLTELDNGHIVATWTDLDSDRVKYRVFDSTGTALTGPSSVDETTATADADPRVVSLGENGFAIVWTDGSAPGDTQIIGRAFDLDGSPSSSRQVLSSGLLASDVAPEIVALDDGEFLLVWGSVESGNNESEILGIRFDDDLTATSEVFTVNSVQSGSQVAPALTVLPNGAIAIAYTSPDTADGGNGSDRDVFVEQVVPVIYTDQDALLDLDLDLLDQDVDGSEVFTGLRISGLPTGSQISDGVNTLTISDPFQTQNLILPENDPAAGMNFMVENLSFRPPDGFLGEVLVTVSYEFDDVGADDVGRASGVGSQSFLIRVTSTTSMIVLTPIAETVSENGTVQLDVASSPGVPTGAKVAEINGQPIQIGASQTLASGATVTLNSDGTITYDPNNQFEELAEFNAGNPNSFGADDFEITFEDNEQELSLTVELTVEGENDAPESRVDFLSTAEDTPLNLTDEFSFLLDNYMDIDGDQLTVVASSFSEPVNGTITVDNLTGDLIYTPDPNSSHIETLTYFVSDGTTETQSTLQIMVEAVNDAPTAATQQLSITTPATGDPSSIGLNLNSVFNDVDAGDSLTFSIIALADEGLVTIDGNGNVIYQLTAPSSSGQDSFQVVAIDSGQLQSEILSVDLNVIDEFAIPGSSNEVTEVTEDTDSNDDGSDSRDSDEDENPAPPMILMPNTVEPPPAPDSLPSLVSDGAISASDNTIEFDGFDDDETTQIGSDNLSSRSGRTYAYALNVEEIELIDHLSLDQNNRRLTRSIEFDADVLASAFLNQLDSSTQHYINDRIAIGTPEVAVSAASLLTVSYLVWNLGSGILVSTFMSSLPTWASFDVLPVISSAVTEYEEDESIEQMVDA